MFNILRALVWLLHVVFRCSAVILGVIFRTFVLALGFVCPTVGAVILFASRSEQYS